METDTKAIVVSLLILIAAVFAVSQIIEGFNVGYGDTIQAEENFSDAFVRGDELYDLTITESDRVLNASAEGGLSAVGQLTTAGWNFFTKLLPTSIDMTTDFINYVFTKYSRFGIQIFGSVVIAIIIFSVMFNLSKTVFNR